MPNGLEFIKSVPLVKSPYEFSRGLEDVVLFHHYLLLKLSDKDPIKSIFESHGARIFAKVLSEDFIVPYGSKSQISALPLERTIFLAFSRDWMRMLPYISEMNIVIDGEFNVSFFEYLSFTSLPDNLHIITPNIRVLGLADRKRILRPVVLDGKRVSFEEDYDLATTKSGAEQRAVASWLHESTTQDVLSELSNERGSRDG